MIALIITGGERSFLLEAKTGRVELTFAVSETTWDLLDATLCAQAPVPVPQERVDPVCGSAYLPIGASATRTVTWPQGARIAISRTSDGGLSVVMLEGTSPGMPIGTRLVVPAEAWKGMGVLAFIARARIGEDIRSGSRGYLQSGRWEARESGLVTSLLRGVTEVVKVGTFASGAYVEVLDKGAPARTYGQIYYANQHGTVAVTLLSEVGDTALSVRHFGFERPVLIRPDWVDVAVSSPILLAATALLTILVATVQFVWNIFLFFPRASSSEIRSDKEH